MIELIYSWLQSTVLWESESMTQVQLLYLKSKSKEVFVKNIELNI